MKKRMHAVGLVLLLVAGVWGQQWTVPESIDMYGDAASQPQIAFDTLSGNGMAVFIQVHNTTDTTVFCRGYSVTGGWQAAVAISEANFGARSARIVALGNDTYLVVWVRTGGGNVRVMSSYFDGFAWSATPMPVDNAGYDSDVPDLAVRRGASSAFAVWRQNSIAGPRIYARRFIGGGGWDAGIAMVSNEGTDLSADSPRIAYDAWGTAIVVFAEYDNFSGQTGVYANRWDGTVWGTPHSMGEYTWASAPRIAMNGQGGAMCVFLNGSASIHAKEYVGTEWVDAGTPNPSGWMQSVGDLVYMKAPGSYMVVYREGELESEVYASRFDGTAWGGPVKLSGGGPTAQERLAVSHVGSKAAAVYVESGHIFARLFDNASWDASPTLIDATANPAGQPCVGFSREDNIVALFRQHDGAVDRVFSTVSYLYKKWDGGGGTQSWDNPQNWQPNELPGAQDTVVFNNNVSPQSCILDTNNPTIAGIKIVSYTGIIDFNGKTLSVTGNVDMFQMDAVANGSGALRFTGTQPQHFTPPSMGDFPTLIQSGPGGTTIAGTSGPVYWGLVVEEGELGFVPSEIQVAGNVTITGGTLVAPSGGTMLVGESWTNSGGAFTHNESSVRFNGSADAQTIHNGTSAFYGLYIEGAVTGEWTVLSANLHVANNFSIVQGTFTAPSDTLYVGGSWSVGTGTFIHNNGTVEFNGAMESQSISPSWFTFYNLKINGTDGAWSVSGDLVVEGNFTLSAGSFSGPTGPMHVRGGWTHSGGTFNGGAVVFDGLGSHTISAGLTVFNSVSFAEAAGVWTLQDSLRAGALELVAGSLNLGAAFKHSVSDIYGTVGSLNLGSSTLRIGGATADFGGLTALSWDGASVEFTNTAVCTLTPPALTTSMPRITMSGTGSVSVAANGLLCAGLHVGSGTWDWGTGLEHLATGVVSGETGASMLFGSSLVRTMVGVNLTGLAITPGTGILQFEGTGVQEFGPSASETHPAIVVDSGGTVKVVSSAPAVKSLTIRSGTWDFNGFDVSVNGEVAVTGGDSATFANLGGRTIEAGGGITLSGQSGNLLDLSPPTQWTISSTGGSILAQHAVIGMSQASAPLGSVTAELSCINTGGNGGWTFSDNTPPTSTISAPSHLSVLNALALISGGATDTETAVSKVEIRIVRIADSHSWNGTQWSEEVLWLQASYSAPDWSYDASAVSWTDGEYMVFCRAFDNALNMENPGSDVTFVIDMTPPVSLVSSPINGSAVNAVSAITGEASDAGGTVTGVELQIKRIADLQYWSGLAWEATEHWLSVDYSGPDWSFDALGVSWSDGEYTVVSRATDDAANVETPGTGVSFLMDMTAPVSAISAPAGGSRLSALVLIEGTSDDGAGSGVASVGLRLVRDSDVHYWNGTQWVDMPAWLEPQGAESWSWDASGVEWADGPYHVAVSATDNAGNAEATAVVAEFVYDATPPTVTVEQGPAQPDPADAFPIVFDVTFSEPVSGFSETCVMIGGTATDVTLQVIEIGAGSSYQIEVNGGTEGTIEVSIPAGCAVDAAGNANEASTSIDNQVTYSVPNATPPVSSVQWPHETVPVTGVASITGDASSGMGKVTRVDLQIMRMVDSLYWIGSSWSDAAQWLGAVYTDQAWSFDASAVLWSDGAYWVVSRASDDASNVEKPGVGITFIYDATLPTATITMPSDSLTADTLGYIAGTADDADGSGVGSVNLRIRRQSDGLHWWETGWSADHMWFGAYGTTEWSFDATSVEWSDGEYVIEAEAVDWAGNRQKSGTAVATFLFSSALPSPTPPQNVTAFQATYLGSGVIQARWARPASTDIDSIIVLQRTDGAYPDTPDSGERIAAVSASDTAVNIGLTAGIAYHCVAFTKSISGLWSGFSAEAADTVFTALGTVAAPQFDPKPGIYASAQQLSLSSATPGAAIHYTTDGSAPTPSSAIYSVPLSISVATTVRAIAVKVDWLPSAESFGEYHIGAEAVVSAGDPASLGVFTGDSLLIPATALSAASTVTMFLENPAAIPPPSGGVVMPGRAVRCLPKGLTFSAPVQLKIRYDKTWAETVDRGALGGYYFDKTLGRWTPVPSIVDTVMQVVTLSLNGFSLYTIGTGLDAPVFSLAPGAYVAGTRLGLSCAVADAAIHFTLDGSEPTESSARYGDSLVLSRSGTVRARAFSPDIAPSRIVEATYTVYVPPRSNFTASPLRGTAPLKVSFHDSSTGDIDSRVWDFGTERCCHSGDNAVPWAYYDRPGLYSVKLVVKGPGGIDSLVRRDYIEVLNTPPVIDSILMLRHVYEGSPVNAVIYYGDPDPGDSAWVEWVSRPRWLQQAEPALLGTGGKARWGVSLYGVAGPSDTGWNYLRFRVRDLAGASVEASDSLYVVAVNRPPTVTLTRRVAGGAVEYTLHGKDDRDSVLSYVLTLTQRGTHIDTLYRDSTLMTRVVVAPLLDGTYRVIAEAIDSEGLRSAPHVDSIVISGATTRAFADTTGWSMMSVPAERLNAAQVKAGGYLVHWDESQPERTLYSYYTPSDQVGELRRARGYWRKSSKPAHVSLSRSQLIDSAVTIALVRGPHGWNQVGSPYSYPVRWPGSEVLWRWNEESRDFEEVEGVLEPWRGYWVHTDSAREVRFDPAPDFSARPLAKRVAAGYTSAGEWRVRMVLTTPTGTDADNIMGVSRAQGGELSKLSRREPPRMTGEGRLFLLRPDRGGSGQEYASDIRGSWGSPTVFQIGVDPGSSGTGMVEFVGLEHLRDVYLFAAGPGGVQLLSPDSAFLSIEGTGVQYRTIFATADRAFGASAPLAFALRRLYPNPFGPVVKIGYTLPYRWDSRGMLQGEPYEVRIRILDAAGRVVRDLVSGRQGPGHYETVWDAKTYTGRPIATGAYFCRIEAGPFSATGQMVTVR